MLLGTCHTELGYNVKQMVFFRLPRPMPFDPRAPKSDSGSEPQGSPLCHKFQYSTDLMTWMIWGTTILRNLHIYIYIHIHIYIYIYTHLWVYINPILPIRLLFKWFVGENL